MKLLREPMLVQKNLCQIKVEKTFEPQFNPAVAPTDSLPQIYLVNALTTTQYAEVAP